MPSAWIGRPPTAEESPLSEFWRGLAALHAALHEEEDWREDEREADERRARFVVIEGGGDA